MPKCNRRTHKYAIEDADDNMGTVVAPTAHETPGEAVLALSAAAEVEGSEPLPLSTRVLACFLALHSTPPRWCARRGAARRERARAPSSAGSGSTNTGGGYHHGVRHASAWSTPGPSSPSS